MKTILLLIVLVLSCSPSAHAQQRVELFGGYSYLGTTSGGAGLPFGAQSDVNVNVNRWLGVEGDFNYNRRFGVNLVTVIGGPRFALRKKRTDLFVDGLIGFTNVSVGGFGLSFSANSLTFGGGGGLNVRIQKHIAIRAIEGDVFSVEKYGEFSERFRVSSGVVLTFGGENKFVPR